MLRGGKVHLQMEDDDEIDEYTTVTDEKLEILAIQHGEISWVSLLNFLFKEIDLKRQLIHLVTFLWVLHCPPQEKKTLVSPEVLFFSKETLRPSNFSNHANHIELCSVVVV